MLGSTSGTVKVRVAKETISDAPINDAIHTVTYTRWGESAGRALPLASSSSLLIIPVSFSLMSLQAALPKSISCEGGL